MAIAVTFAVLVARRHGAARFGVMAALVLALGFTHLFTPVAYAVEESCPAAATPDTSTGVQGAKQVYNVLDNDRPSPGASFVLGSLTLGLAPGHVLGTSVSEDKKTVTAPNEGVYVAGDNGTITFTPEPDFVGSAVGVVYSIRDTAGKTISSVYAPTVTGPGGAVCVPVSPVALGHKKMSISFDAGGEQARSSLLGEDARLLDMSASDSGSYVAAVRSFDSSDGNSESWLYLSQDDGRTWVKRGMVELDEVFGTYVVDDGQTLIAWGDNWSVEGDSRRLIASTDGGMTWATQSFSSDSSTHYDLSAAPDRLYEFDETNTTIRSSSNMGASWSPLSLPPELTGAQRVLGVTASRDGGIVAISYWDAAYQARAIISRDGGSSWQAVSQSAVGMQTYILSGMSSDGSVVVLSGSDGSSPAIAISHDQGQTWLADSMNASVTHVSSDGQRMMIEDTNDDNRVYFSSDGGQSWVERTPSFSTVYAFASAGDLSTIIGYDHELSRIVTWNNVTTSWDSWLMFPIAYSSASIDIDPSTPGKQVTVDRRATEGWHAAYDPAQDILTLYVTDRGLFDAFRESLGEDDGYVKIDYSVVDSACGFAIAYGEVVLIVDER